LAGASVATVVKSSVSSVVVVVISRQTIGLCRLAALPTAQSADLCLKVNLSNMTLFFSPESINKKGILFLPVSALHP
jgi:hypothetical protein